MPLEFGDDFCAACEPCARIWHKGGSDDPIGVAIVDELDGQLPEIHAISWLGWYLTVPLTVWNMLSVTIMS